MTIDELEKFLKENNIKILNENGKEWYYIEKENDYIVIYVE